MLFTGLDVGDGEAVDGVAHALAGGDDLGGNLLGGEVGLVHRDLAAVGVLDHGIVVGGEVDGGDGRPDGGGVDLRDTVLDVEGARLVGAGERGGFLIELSRLGVVLLDTGARLVDSK